MVSSAAFVAFVVRYGLESIHQLMLWVMIPSMIPKLLALVESFAANGAEVFGNLVGTFWPCFSVGKRFFMIFPFMSLLGLFRGECADTDSARIWANHALGWDIGLGLKPECSRRTSSNCPTSWLHLFCDPRFGTPLIFVTNIWPRFGTFTWNCTFSESGSGHRHTIGFGMASVASGMLRYRLDGRCSGCRRPSAWLILSFLGPALFFWHDQR